MSLEVRNTIFLGSPFLIDFDTEGVSASNKQALTDQVKVSKNKEIRKQIDVFTFR